MYVCVRMCLCTQRNSKAYRDDVTLKISQLREQLFNKDEELSQHRALLGRRARQSVCGCACVRACVRARVRLRVRLRGRGRVRVRVRGRGRGRVRVRVRGYARVCVRGALERGKLQPSVPL